MAAEDAGTIAAQIRLELNQMEKDGLQAQKMMDGYALKFKEQGLKGGKMYVQGFGNAQFALNTKLNNMVSSLQGVSPKMGALGDRMAKVFSKPIFTMVPALSAAFQAMLPIIGTVIAAVAGLIKIISSAANKQREFNDNIKKASEAQEAMTRAVNAGTAEAKKQTEAEERREKALMKIRLAFTNMIRPVKDAADAVKNALGAAFTWVLERIGDFAGGLGLVLGALSTVLPALAPVAAGLMAFGHNVNKVTDEAVTEALELQKLAGVYGELEVASSSYEKEMNNIITAERLLGKTQEETAKAKLQAADSYLQKLIEQREEAKAVLMLDEEAARNNPRVKAIEDQIAAIKAQRDEWELLAETRGNAEKADKTDAERIEEARLAAVEKYAQAVKTANDARAAGLVTEEELEKQLETARARHYGDLEAIAVQYRDATGEAKAQLDITKELRDETAGMVKDYQDTVRAMENQEEISRMLVSQSDKLYEQEIARRMESANSAKTEEERTAAINSAIDLENQLIDIRRQREWELIEESEAYKAASDEERKRILDNFNAITDGMKKAKEEMKNKGGSFLENFFGNAGFDKLVQAAGEAANAVQAVIEKQTRKYIKELEKRRDEQFKIWDEEMQERLYQMGLADAATREQYERDLQLAIESGDQRRIFEADEAMRRYEVEKEYADKKENLENEVAGKKAEAEHKAAMTSWYIQCAQAAAGAAQAIIQSIAAAPGWPLNAPFVAIATATGAAQLAAVKASKPVLQFSTGGIVPGNSLSGDKITAGLNSKEMILNTDQQKNLLDIATEGGNNGAPKTLNLIIYLNSRVIAKAVVEDINNKHELIFEGSIAR